jgi:hypothetical protein
MVKNPGGRADLLIYVYATIRGDTPLVDFFYYRTI